MSSQGGRGRRLSISSLFGSNKDLTGGSSKSLKDYSFKLRFLSFCRTHTRFVALPTLTAATPAASVSRTFSGTWRVPRSPSGPG